MHAFPSKISGKELVQYVRGISTDSGFGGKENYARVIARYPDWTLGEFDLADLHPDDLANVRNMEGVEFRFKEDLLSPAERIRDYARKTTPVPPVIFNRKGRLVDGFHRVGAALLKGESKISAYLPLVVAAKCAPVDPASPVAREEADISAYALTPETAHARSVEHIL